MYATLSNGSNIGRIGLGVWKSPADDVTIQAVKAAVDVGYRHFDGAFIYQNEAQLGQAINEKIKEGVIKREDVFITTKLWNNCHQPDAVKPHCEVSLKNLGLKYIDMYLMHWPIASEEIYSGVIDVDYLDTWKAMEKLVDEGLVKNIGVSNFNGAQLKRLLENCRIKPSNIQIEVHPFLPNRQLVEFAQSQGLVVTAYSPFASPDPKRSWRKATDPNPLVNETLKAVGDKYNKSPAQVILRWLLQRNIVAIPKSVTPERIAQNFQVFDFELSEEDMNAVYALDCGFRLCAGKSWLSSPYHPFKDELHQEGPY